MVGNGCLAPRPNSNCSWISGDAVFLTRASGYEAEHPDSLNDKKNWEFYCGNGSSSVPATEPAGGGSAGSTECWTADVDKAKPILTWEGRVGTGQCICTLV